VVPVLDQIRQAGMHFGTEMMKVLRRLANAD
jgi:hypothetical protein